MYRARTVKTKCAHPSCKTVCNPERYCYGCKETVCAKHDVSDVWAIDHEAHEHWAPRQCHDENEAPGAT